MGCLAQHWKLCSIDSPSAFTIDDSLSILWDEVHAHRRCCCTSSTVTWCPLDSFPNHVEVSVTGSYGETRLHLHPPSSRGGIDSCVHSLAAKSPDAGPHRHPAVRADPIQCSCAFPCPGMSQSSGPHQQVDRHPDRSPFFSAVAGFTGFAGTAFSMCTLWWTLSASSPDATPADNASQHQCVGNPDCVPVVYGHAEPTTAGLSVYLLSTGFQLAA